MGYLDFKGLVKKVDLKADGDVNILLTVSGEELRGKIEYLHEMIGEKVSTAFDSTVVNYNIEINARTEKPIKSYRVDDSGVVSEVKPQGEQLTMDNELGLPPEKIEIKKQPAEIDLAVIEEFIQSGLAPTFEDLDYNFVSFSERLATGETYMKLASELGVSSGKIVQIIDDYRKRVAPSAAAWHEWRTGMVQPEPVVKKEAADVVSSEVENPDEVGTEGGSESAGGSDKSEGNDTQEGGSNIDTGDGTGKVDSTDPADPAGADESSKEELDAFILANRPIFPEVEYDGQPIPFPDLLEKRLKEDKTWREIANERGMTSGQLSARWSAYRKLATKKKNEGGGAA